MLRLSTKQHMRRIFFEIYCFSGEKNPRDSADKSRPKLRWGKVLSGRRGNENVSKRKRKRALAIPLQDRRKGTKGS